MVLSFKFPEPVFCSVTRENDVELPHETLVLSFKKKTKKKTKTTQQKKKKKTTKKKKKNKI